MSNQNNWLNVVGVLVFVVIMWFTVSCQVDWFHECRQHGGSWTYCFHVATAR